MKQLLLLILLTTINPPPHQHLPSNTWIVWCGSTYQLCGKPEWNGKEWVYRIGGAWGPWEVHGSTVEEEYREHWGRVWRARWGQ